MKYIVRCALAPEQAMTLAIYDYAGSSDYCQWNDELGAEVCTWPGRLGLAPNWVAQGTLNDRDQFLVSACLMAVTNADGRAGVSLSLRGPNVAFGPEEIASHPIAEAAFWGNLFKS